MVTSPQLLWDRGIACDLFASLGVLHEPDKFGVRGAWAAGVRARLPADEREALARAFNARAGFTPQDGVAHERFFTPLQFGPFEGAQLPAEDFAEALNLCCEMRG